MWRTTRAVEGAAIRRICCARASFGPALSAFMQGVLAEDWALIGPRPGAGSNGLLYPAPDNLEGVDKLLYKAKYAGRNRVESIIPPR